MYFWKNYVWNVWWPWAGRMDFSTRHNSIFCCKPRLLNIHSSPHIFPMQISEKSHHSTLWFGRFWGSLKLRKLDHPWLLNRSPKDSQLAAMTPFICSGKVLRCLWQLLGLSPIWNQGCTRASDAVQRFNGSFTLGVWFKKMMFITCPNDRVFFFLKKMKA